MKSKTPKLKKKSKPVVHLKDMQPKQDPSGGADKKKGPEAVLGHEPRKNHPHENQSSHQSEQTESQSARHQAEARRHGRPLLCFGGAYKKGFPPVTAETGLRSGQSQPARNIRRTRT